jgi:hypothetical protein
LNRDSKLEPNEYTLKMHPFGRLKRKSLRASMARLMLSPYIEPLLSRRNMYSHFSMSKGAACSNYYSYYERTYFLSQTTPAFKPIFAASYFDFLFLKSGKRFITKA